MISSKCRIVNYCLRLSRPSVRNGVAMRAFIADKSRAFHVSVARRSGALADVCDLNIVSSPFPPIMESSEYTPVPEFVSVDWKNPKMTNKVGMFGHNFWLFLKRLYQQAFLPSIFIFRLTRLQSEMALQEKRELSEIIRNICEFHGSIANNRRMHQILSHDESYYLGFWTRTFL